VDKCVIWIGLILSFALVEATNEKISARREQRFLAPPPEHIELFHFGFSESLADSLWLRWIQDSDICQTYLKPVETNEVQSAENKDRLWNPRYKNCDNSWSFKMLEAITNLAPLFRMPYLAGGISLSVLTEDYAGATIIFDRGVRRFPEDWTLAYRAAYHYLFDLQNKERAAELLIQAGKHGAPFWVNLLASRLYSDSGQAELGISVLEAYKAQLDDEEQIKFVEKRIENLKRAK